MRHTIGCWCAVAVVSLVGQQVWAQENWPQFRGADSLGVSTNANLPDRWSATDNVAWKAEIRGQGWSSPIVWGDKIFLTTCVNLAENEEPKKGLYFGGDRPKPPESEHQWRTIALDLKTGDVVWDQLAHQGVPSAPKHLKNSYASETPVTDGQRIYAYFGNVGVFCYDLEGKPLWKRPIEPHAVRFGWGTASSPLVYQDRVYIVDDNDDASYLLVLDARTGEELFRVERNEKSNWATPYLWKNSQRVEIVTPGTKMNRSYDPEGRLLWELGGMSSITIATPYAKDDILYLSSGYVLDQIRPIYAVRAGASGDITLVKDENSSPYIAWCNLTAGPYNPTTLLADDLLYVLYDQGFFVCLDAKTGEPVYKKQRIPEGKAFTASPWSYGDKIFCVNEDGSTFVIRAGRNFEILHTNSLADDDMCMATPAMAGDRLILRTAKRVYCLRNASRPAP